MVHRIALPTACSDTIDTGFLDTSRRSRIRPSPATSSIAGRVPPGIPNQRLDTDPRNCRLSSQLAFYLRAIHFA